MSGLERLHRWFLAPRPLHGLVACRVIFGASLAAAHAERLALAADAFGPEGIGGAGLYARLPELPAFAPGAPAALDLLRAVPSQAAVSGLALLLVASALAFALGLLTRPAGVLALGLHVLFWARDPYAFSDWAAWGTGPLLYTVLAPTGRHLSLDAWRRRRRGAPAASWWGPGWPLRLLQIQLCTLYFAAAFGRLDAPLWLEGDLVQAALSGAANSRFVLDWTPWAPLLRPVTWAALALELLAPLALWLPGVGRFWALALVLLHVGLEATLHLGYWSHFAVGALLTFVLPWQRPAAPAPAPRASTSRDASEILPA